MMKLLVMAGILLLYSCGDDATPKETDDSKRVEEVVDSPMSLATLPGFAPVDCDVDQVLAPEGDVWIHSVDDIIWGTILEIKPLNDTFVSLNNESLVLEECRTGVSKPGLLIKILVERSIKRRLFDSINVYVTAEQASTYMPNPSIRDNGSEIEWNALEGPLSEALEVNHSVGMALHYISDYEIWSLMGELMFTLEENHESEMVVKFQSSPFDCVRELPPSNIEGLSLDEMEFFLKSTKEDDRSIDRESFMYLKWGPNGMSKERYTSSGCFVAE